MKNNFLICCKFLFILICLLIFLSTCFKRDYRDKFSDDREAVSGEDAEIFEEESIGEEETFGNELIAEEEVSSAEEEIPEPEEFVCTGRTERVKYAIDGDTVLLYNDEKVRYIGVDTPETINPDPDDCVCYGEEAKKFNKELVTDQAVCLEFDKEEIDKILG